jgi:hypothetical protein
VEWAVYPLAAALVVAALAVLVIVVRAAMPIKFDVTIRHEHKHQRDDETGES